MEAVEKLLASSEVLYSHLAKLPKESQREAFIERIEWLLETRENDLLRIQKLSKIELRQHHLATVLMELDKGIQERMEKVMDVIKKDIRDFQVKRKSDASYSNPYAATQTIDGMYYDKKK
jgi:hypothetical protein